MNAQNVYDLIKESLNFFDLNFNQMKEITVTFDKDSITLYYKNEKITVNTK